MYYSFGSSIALFETQETRKSQSAWIRQWLNPRASIYWIILLVRGNTYLYSYFLFPRIGKCCFCPRNPPDWYNFFMTGLIAFQLTVTVLIIRVFLILPKPLAPPPTSLLLKFWNFIKEALFNGLLMGIGTLLFLIWDINTVLNFQMFNLQGNAVLLCAFGFGFASMFFNLIAQITEKFTAHISGRGCRYGVYRAYDRRRNYIDLFLLNYVKTIKKTEELLKKVIYSSSFGIMPSQRFLNQSHHHRDYPAPLHRLR